ncbi:MAG TPA: hemerythrin [Gammaproteobacteria bacterium]|nr:hemerythrin [Gammaproteobacteria bacterium]
MLIEWSDELSVGIQEIDEQHKALVGLVNDMHDAIQQHHGSEVTSDILQRLAEYTKIHFAVEESLFRIFDYPGYEAHKKQHDELLNEVVELQEKINSGKGSISFQLLHFLKMWLTQHILDSDKEYSAYLLKSGLKEKSSKSGWFKKLWH